MPWPHYRNPNPDKRNEYEYPDPCPETPTSPPYQLPKHVPTTTVMIYLAGDNNLSEECVYALNELKKAKPPEGTVRVFAQYDPSDEFLPTQRYEIRFDTPARVYDERTDPYPLARDLRDQYPFKHESKSAFYIRPPFGERKERKGEGGTGDPKMLYNFIAYCVDQHPKTDYYVLIVCGHGAGIYRDYLLRDDRPDGYLTIYELRKALKWMNRYLTNKDGDPLVLEIFGMDVCLMSMAEVSYELRDYVKIAIGCESYSPAAGWPYRETIDQIRSSALAFKNRQVDQATTRFALNWEVIATDIVKEYVRFYSDYWLAGLSVSMSAIRVDKVRRLKELVRELADVMILELRAEACEREKSQTQTGKDYDYRDPKYHPRLSFTDALVLAHWRAQSYNGELYVDLADFCNCLKVYAPSYIREACEKLSYFIQSNTELTILSCFWGRHYQYSYGISIYFPWDSIMPYYGASIGFPAKSRWVNFLKEYVAATRRAPREFPIYSPCLDDPKVLAEIRAKNNAEARMGSDKMGSDKMGSDKGGNPIHSMRNPPIVFMPDPCIGDCCVRWHNNHAQYLLMKDVEEDHEHYDDRADDNEYQDNPPLAREADNDDNP